MYPFSEQKSLDDSTAGEPKKCEYHTVPIRSYNSPFRTLNQDKFSPERLKNEYNIS